MTPKALSSPLKPGRAPVAISGWVGRKGARCAYIQPQHDQHRATCLPETHALGSYGRHQVGLVTDSGICYGITAEHGKLPGTLHNVTGCSKCP